MKNTILLILCLLAGTSAVAQKCDCTITPYKPTIPCFDYCWKLKLIDASEDYLKNTIKIPETVVLKIKEVQRQKLMQVYTLEDYSKYLKPADYNILMDKLKSSEQIKIEESNPK